MLTLKAIGAPILFLLLAANAPVAELELAVERLRNDKGMLHVCLTQNERHFPNCSGDPQAVRRSVPASARAVFFGQLAPGSYAISILHDENDNGRMDKFIGIPREGFAFSGESAPRFGPPSFSDAAIELKGLERHVLSMRYVL